MKNQEVQYLFSYTNYFDLEYLEVLEEEANNIFPNASVIHAGYTEDYVTLNVLFQDSLSVRIQEIREFENNSTLELKLITPVKGCVSVYFLQLKSEIQC